MAEDCKKILLEKMFFINNGLKSLFTLKYNFSKMYLSIKDFVFCFLSKGFYDFFVVLKSYV